MRLLFICLLICFIAINQGYGQENAQNINKAAAAVDAKQILQKAAAASLRVQTIEYREEQFYIDQANAKAPFIMAAIRQGRSNVPEMGYMPGKFMVEGRLTNDKTAAAEGFAYSYDGQSFRIRNASEKIVQVVKSQPRILPGRFFPRQD